MSPGPIVIRSAANNEHSVSVGFPTKIEGLVAEGRKVQLSSSSEITRRINSAAKLGDIDVLGASIKTLIDATEDYDPKKLRGPSGIAKFFNRSKSGLKARYESVDQQVQGLIGKLTQQVDFFRARDPDYVALGVEIQNRRHELQGLIERFNTEITWAENNAPIVDPVDSESARLRANWDQAVLLAKNTVSDFQRSIALLEQQAVHVDVTRANGMSLVQVFDSLMITVVPEMQRTYALYILQTEQKKGADLAALVREKGNQAIRANADMLHSNTVAVQTQLTASNISLETLNYSFDKTAQTLRDMRKLQGELANRLKVEGPAIEALSQKLVTELAGNSSQTRVITGA